MSELEFPKTLEVTEQTIDISGFTRKQKDFYLNLFWETVAFYTAAQKPRVAIGMAGPTGAGKSVVSMLFKALAGRAGLPFAFESVTIDAYHFPNRFLLSHYSEGVPLKQVKGRFDTYDAAALIADLKHFAAGETVLFPVYSRKLHDPVPAGIRLETKAALLVVEGLWLLSDFGVWGEVRPLLDFCYFIDSDPERTRSAVLQRHVTGGRTWESATKHYDEVDGRNADLVMQTRPKADQVIPPYYLVQ
jgi:pantothenate kinase